MEGLEILKEMTNEELDVIVELIKDKGGITESLTNNPDYIEFYPDHQKYVYAIEKEILAYGSNTLWKNKSYREIVCDVCDKVDAPYRKEFDLEHIEHNLLEKVLEKVWAAMEGDARKEMLKALGKGADNFAPQAGAAAFIALFNAGGAMSYQITAAIANGVANLIVGRGLSLAANAGLARIMGFLTGPIGMSLTAIWTAITLAGPAYRVTIPLVTYIAAVRQVHESNIAVEIDVTEK